MARGKDFAQKQREEAYMLAGWKKDVKKLERAKKMPSVPSFTLSDLEGLDRATVGYMNSKGFNVEKREDPINMRVTYRFIDPATGCYYDQEVDEVYDSAMAWGEIVYARNMAIVVAEEKFRLAREEDSRMAKKVMEALSKTPPPATTYKDAEGRIWHTKIEGETKFPVPKSPIHKEGHFPTHWMEEAMDRAEASEKCITLTIERNGVMVVAVEGEDKYASHVITWEMMEKSEVNPLPLAIEDVEKKLDLLHKVKAKVKEVSK